MSGRGYGDYFSAIRSVQMQTEGESGLHGTCSVGQYRGWMGRGARRGRRRMRRYGGQGGSFSVMRDDVGGCCVRRLVRPSLRWGFILSVWICTCAHFRCGGLQGVGGAGHDAGHAECRLECGGRLRCTGFGGLTKAGAARSEHSFRGAWGRCSTVSFTAGCNDWRQTDRQTEFETAGRTVSRTGGEGGDAGEPWQSGSAGYGAAGGDEFAE